MQVTFVKYHSARWDLLVELGWITETVERWDNGQRMARMVRERTVSFTDMNHAATFNCQCHDE